MSRSRKKHPYYQLLKNKHVKKAYNRKIRMENVDVGNNMEYKKHFESYEVCDWHCFAPNDPKAYRK